MKENFRLWSLSAGALIIFLGLAVASSRTNAPWEDESWFGSATFHLMTEGRLATDLIEGAGTWRAGTTKHFSWEPPLSFVTNSIFCKIVGFNIFTIRTTSILWGCLALACCGLLVWRLTGSARATVLALVLISVDYFFLLGASEARMDVMCFALGIAGLTSYMLLRERSLSMALVISQAFVAMSGMTHPNGALWFGCVAAAVLIYDRRRLTVRSLVWAAAPYLVGAIGWGLFIAADPHDFVTQFFGNIKESGASNTLNQSPLLTPIAGFLAEMRERYLGPYGLLSSGGLNRLKAIVLAIYLSGIAICLGVRSLRSHPAVRLLLVMTLIVFLLLAFVMGNKWSRYLVHIVPLWAMLLAFVLDRAFDRPVHFRLAAIAVLLVMAALQWGGILYHVRENTYAHAYLPTAEFMKQNSSPASFIVGPAGFYWMISSKRQFSNDLRLGYFTGKHADMIVINDWYRVVLLNAPSEPAHDYARRLLTDEYEQKWTKGEYAVYLRKPLSATQAAASTQPKPLAQ